MPRPLSIALIAGLCLAFTVRAEDKPKPSPAVKRILDKAVAKVRTNRQDFDKANEKPLDEARVELRDLAKKLVDDGKSDEATAVLGHVKTLEADVMRQANATTPVGGAGEGRDLTQKALLERLQGKWQNSEGREVDIRGDVVQQSNGDRAQLTLVSPDVAVMVWRSGYKWKFTVRPADEDLIPVMEWDSKGKRSKNLVLERIK